MQKENKQILIICRGLPASGKSTFARDWVAADPASRVQVEKDEIRHDASLFRDGVYNHRRGDESLVVKERDKRIHTALVQGKSVISSDTNLVQKHVSQMSSIARKYGVEVKIKKFLDVPIGELISRDSKRQHPVGEQVIRKMFHDHVKSMPTFLGFDPELPFVVVSDLDGTLTLGPKNRSPFDWHKVGNDDINLGVSSVIDGIQFIDGKKGTGETKLFIFSGRDEVCRPETEEWLERHDIEYDELYMRRSDHVDEHGNQVNDAEVKAEMIEKYIKGKYNVLIWFDDRPRVATMLRDVYGINVAQLGDTRYEF